MLWNGTVEGQEDTLYYLTYSADGTPGPIQTATAPLYDCPPIYYNGKVVWYIAEDSVPTFYTLDSNGVTTHIAAGSAVLEEQTTQTAAPNPEPTPEPDPTPNPGGTVSFSDVPTTHWAYPYVSRAAENGWVKGVGNGQFVPNDTLSFAEFYTMVTPIFAANELAAYQAPAGSQWWQPYMWIGGRNFPAFEIWLDTSYVGPVEFAPDYDEKTQKSIAKHANEPIDRYNAVTIMWEIIAASGAAEHFPGFDDAWNELYEAGVDLRYLNDNSAPGCYAAGLITGDENGNLNLEGKLTRAEGCTMLCNLVDYMLEYGRMSGTGEYIPFQLPDLS